MVLEVRIAQKQTPDAWTGIAGSGRVETRPLSVSNVMRADLAAQEPDAFDIRRLDASTDEQLITAGQPTSWRWQLIPLHDGDKVISLVARMRLAGLETGSGLKVNLPPVVSYREDDRVSVSRDLLYVVSRTLPSILTLPFLYPALGVIGGGILSRWQLRRRRRRQQVSGPAPPAGAGGTDERDAGRVVSTEADTPKAGDAGP